MQKIPLYIIEEHHEAFYVWNYAIEKGEMCPWGSALLHVDHHPDFESGAYRDLDQGLFGSLKQKHHFCYHSLGIADFICPSLYQGIFDTLVWVNKFLSPLPSPVHKWISKDAQNVLIMGEVNSFIRQKLTADTADHRFFRHTQGGLGDVGPLQRVVLDIDLDYFCWDDSLSTAPEKLIEITPAAYEDYCGNNYNPFRILPRALLQAVEIDQKYYLQYKESVAPDPMPTKERILRRMDLFAQWLKEQNIRPQIIDICRSVHSGYTPLSVWEWMEQELLDRLGEVYNCEDPRHVNSLTLLTDNGRF